MAWRIPRVATVAAFAVVTLWLLYATVRKLPYKPLDHKLDPEPDLEPVIEIPRYETWGIRDLSEVIQVASLRVQPAFQHERLPMRQSADFTIPFTEVNLTQSLPELSTGVAYAPAESHIVPDASHLLVGMATKLDRLPHALSAFIHWASGTNVRFVVVVEPPQPGGPSIEEIKQLYESHNILITLVESELPWYEAYVSLLGVLHDHATPETKWVCTIDDDTYFFSMKRLLAMLARYDHNEPYYIAGVSENKETIDRLGLLGYGGGGLFFSMALIKELRPYLEHCITMPDSAGDIRIFRCIYTYTTTKLTWEHYLFQMDIHGDLSGFYEAARTRPLSTHHWDSWHHTDMVQVGAVGEICGNECVLQKYVTADGWYMTNGYSLVKYSYNETERARYIEGAMEHTWADTAWVIPTSWNYTLAPLKPRDEGKIQYKIEKVEQEQDTVTLYYVRRDDGLGLGIVRMMWENKN